MSQRIMGIHDRDYMKRGPADEPRDDSSSDDKLDAFLTGFLQRNPRFFLFLTLGLGILILIGLFLAGLFGPNS